MTNTFELATWYDTWNQTGLDNLTSKLVPLNYASRYNLAFGKLVPGSSGAYIVEMGHLADQVNAAIRAQTAGKSISIYAGLGDAGILEAVADNQQNGNRSTASIVSWLQSNNYNGICIDAEGSGMPSVTTFVAQLSASFKTANLGIAVSVPWPAQGPTALYGSDAVDAFNSYVDAAELQDYSSGGTTGSVPVWTQAGVSTSILMGGICTENSDVQTSLPDAQAWTVYALKNGLRGMFSWRLDNDHGTQGKKEDVDPTFMGAQTIWEVVYAP